jgi:type II secretory pathway pseudopilin PulG
MKAINILIPMKLAGQATRRGTDAGYAMAALLIALSIMAVMLTVAMPVWKQMTQREKEEELVFRGMQYAHAIALFQRKYANAYPPNVNVLVEQRFLRKKFKDPITNDDFVPIAVGQGLPGSPQTGQRGSSATGSGPGSSASGRGLSAASPTTSTTQTGLGTSPSTAPIGGGPGIQATAGINGVTSKSKDASIRIYNGRSHYNEWAFVYTPQFQAAGQGGGPGAALPGQRGGRGQPVGPGQRGQQPTDPFGRGRPGGPPNPFGPATGGGRGFGPGPGTQQPMQPIFGPQPTPRGRQ